LKRVRDAFTLIELLVVIAIIAILAAILFPVFAQARRVCTSVELFEQLKAAGPRYYAVCTGLRRKISTVDLVRQRRRWQSPGQGGPARRTCRGDHGRNNHIGWDKTTQPYIKNAQVFKCPSNDNGRRDIGHSITMAETTRPRPGP